MSKKLDYITTEDFSKEKLLYLIDLSFKIKACIYAACGGVVANRSIPCHQNARPSDLFKEICKEFGKLFNSINVENVKIKFIEYTIDNKIKLKRICQKMKKEV